MNRILFFVLLMLFSSEIVGPVLADDLSSELKSAWTARRNVSRYIRCSIDVLRVTSAGMTDDARTEEVEEFREYLFDTEQRRLRLFTRSAMWNQDHFDYDVEAVAIYTPESMARYNITSAKIHPGLPAIVEVPMPGRNPFLDAAVRFSPPAWAMGLLPDCGIEQQNLNLSLFEVTPGDGGMVRLKPKNDSLDLRYEVDPSKDYAIVKCYYRYKPEVSWDLTTNAVWEKLPEGWYPRSWQEDLGGTETCRVREWEFLDTVDESLWEEPEGLREPGRLVFNEQGRQKLDTDLSLIPPDARLNQSWSVNPIVFSAIFLMVVLVFAWWKRR